MNNEGNNINQGGFGMPSTPQPSTPTTSTNPMPTQGVTYQTAPDVFNQPVGASIPPTPVVPTQTVPTPSVSVQPSVPPTPVQPAPVAPMPEPMPNGMTSPQMAPMPTPPEAPMPSPMTGIDVDKMGAEVHPDLNVTPINVNQPVTETVVEEPKVSETLAQKKKRTKDIIFIVVIIVIVFAFIMALPYLFKMF